MLKSALERDMKARPFEKPMREFGEILKDDEGLYKRLSETPSKESFVTLYLDMAAERGFNFSRDDMEVAVQEQKQGQNWIIPPKVQRLIRERF